MTINEKIAFWRKVMEYANDRGIEVYLFNWHIFTIGEMGKYGIIPELIEKTEQDIQMARGWKVGDIKEYKKKQITENTFKKWKMKRAMRTIF